MNLLPEYRGASVYWLFHDNYLAAKVLNTSHSETARKIISQESTLWDFCKGCKIGCPYEVSAFTNSPMLALESGLNFLRIL